MEACRPGDITRRDVLRGAAAAVASNAALNVGAQASPQSSSQSYESSQSSAMGAAPAGKGAGGDAITVRLRINGRDVALALDPRTTLLDALREHAGLTGTKKGCDHGQCGACTVLVEGRRINSCLSLAVMHEGDSVTTIEGLAQGERLHPLQAAFIKHDGMQCGYCTPGQICSAAGMLAEAKASMPSHASADLQRPALDAGEIRERMSGNICRCSCYPNIVAAIAEVAGVRT